MSIPPEETYLRTMTTEQAVDLLIALRHWIWEIHGDRIAPEGDEDPFANRNDEMPDFLMEYDFSRELNCGYAHSGHDRISAVLNDR